MWLIFAERRPEYEEPVPAAINRDWIIELSLEKEDESWLIIAAVQFGDGVEPVVVWKHKEYETARRTLMFILNRLAEGKIVSLAGGELE